MNFELAQRLVEAKDLNEALNVQREFARQTVETYVRQLQELSSLVTSRGTPSREPSFEYSAAAELRLEGVGVARILRNFEPSMEISCRH